MVRQIEIECLFAPGCGSRHDTLALVERLAAEMALKIELRETVVACRQEAEEQHFLGSPSVRINGQDIEPGADSRTDYGMG